MYMIEDKASKNA